MPIIQRSIVVSPCYAIEDLPTNLGNDAAADFLTAWTIGWDPRLIAGLGFLPEWKRCDSSALELEKALVLIPEIAKEKVDIPQRERLDLGKSLTIDTEQRSRPELWDAIRYAIVTNGDRLPTSEPLLLGDFYALGYLVLQVQIMARKLRYSWNLDWLAFSEQVLGAAKASVEGNLEETERWLQAGFDSLSQERDRYCSQQIHLLNVVLLAKSTLGESLQKQLADPSPVNYLANGALLRDLQKDAPEAWGLLQSKLRDGTASVIGGLEEDIQCNYASYLGVDDAFTRGKEAYISLGLEPPKVFSQFSPGMGSLLPDILLNQGFQGVFLNAWSGGRVPGKDSAKIRWQSHSEGEMIDCIIGNVADASNGENFLHLTSLLSKQLDYHHVPTLVLAHWPGQVADAMSDLLRVMQRSPALGKFESVETYFKTTNQPYGSDAYIFRQFQVPLPEDSVAQQNLHAQLAGLHRLRANASQLRSTAALWNHMLPTKVGDELVVSNREFERRVHTPSSMPLETNDRIVEYGSALDKNRGDLTRVIVAANGWECPSAQEANGYLFINTASHPRRVFVSELPGEVEEASSTRIVATHTYANRSQLVVDLPPFGVVKVRASNISEHLSPKKPQVQRQGLLAKLTGGKRQIADGDWSLANEYMEIQIDPKKGHLRSVYIPSKRGSRISGMPSLVLGPPLANRKWKEEDFLVPKQSSLRLLESTPLCGVIETTNVFQMPDGSKVDLITRYRLWKGSRWLEVEIECPALHKQQFHAVWRTAWANESALLNSWQQGTKGKMPGPLQGMIELIEIDDVENKTYLATQGLSIHHRFEQRYLVSTLPYAGEKTAKQQVGIGLDWPRPWETANDFFVHPTWCKGRVPTDQIDAGAWLAQANIPNVRIEFEQNGPFQLLVEEGDDPIPFDSVLSLSETRGKRAVSKLSFSKNVEDAWRIDSELRPTTKLDVENGQILANLRPSERCRIAVRWSKGI